jgi:hypothetical protein
MIRATLLSALIGLSIPAAGAGQVVQTFDRSPIGCGCELRLREVATLDGDHTGSSNVVAAVHAERGLLFTTNRYWRDRVLVYQFPRETGTAPVTLRQPLREIGRSGEGPGEFRNVMAVAVVGDTLVVLDEQHERASLFTLEGEFLDSFRLPGKPKLRALAAGDGTIIGHFGVATEPAEPVLFEIRIEDGMTIHRFGGRDERRGIADAITIAGQRIAGTANGEVLAAWPGTYLLHRYGADRDLETVFDRSLEAFPRMGIEENYAAAMRRRAAEAGGPAADLPVDPAVQGIWQMEENGWIGVALAIPLRATRPGPGARRGLVELWDPAEGAVVASLQTPVLRIALGSGYLLEATATADGMPHVVLWKLEVRPRAH